MPSFDELTPNVGYLTDKKIMKCLENGFLLEKGTWDPGQVRHASYTLRLGSRVELARAADSIGSITREMRVVTLTKSRPDLELLPGDTALLYSSEVLRFPLALLGFTVARGLLFAEALSPENTYVDPGFTGPIYTSVTNVSNRVIQLTFGMPLARLFFFRLSEEVGEPYRTGSALGITQQLHSVRAVAFGGQDELGRASDTQLRDSVRLVPIGGVHASELLRRMHKRMLVANQRIIAFALLWPVLLLLANSSEWLAENIGPLLSNILAGLITTMLVWLVPRIVGWIRSVTD